MISAFARLARSWNAVLLTLIALALVAGWVLSPYFLSIDNLMSQTRDLMVVEFLALGLAPVVIMGEIDLSGEANLAVCAVTLGLMFEQNVNIWLASGLVVLLGAVVGAMNGALVVALRLPSLIVTLATLISLRGLAFVLVEERPIAGFPESFVALGNRSLGSSLNSAVARRLFHRRSSGLVCSQPHGIRAMGLRDRIELQREQAQRGPCELGSPRGVRRFRRDGRLRRGDSRGALRFRAR